MPSTSLENAAAQMGVYGFNDASLRSPETARTSTHSQIGERKVEQKPSASPRVGRVPTFIANVAALAMWVLAAIPGASLLSYFYGKFHRQEVQEREKPSEPVVAPAASEISVATPTRTAEQQTAIAASEIKVSFYKICFESLKSAFIAGEPVDVMRHLADFCERRRQIALADSEFAGLDFENNKDLKKFVANPNVQDFLSKCIESIHTILNRGKVTEQQKCSLRDMLPIIADLKALPNSDTNTLIRLKSPTPIKFSIRNPDSKIDSQEIERQPKQQT